MIFVAVKVGDLIIQANPPTAPMRVTEVHDGPRVWLRAVAANGVVCRVRWQHVRRYRVLRLVVRGAG